MLNSDIVGEIDKTKQLLIYTAKKYKYNFRHPKVLAVSEKLDDLILECMKKKLSP